MTSNQFDPRTMAEAQSVTNFTPGQTPAGYARESAWVVWVQFAGVMLILTGSLHIMQGLMALFRDEVYAVGKNGLVLNIDYTAWGWAHLVWGAIAVLVGFCLLAGQMWARVVGVLVAFVSVLGNIAFLGANPVWGAIVIAIDIAIIWAIMIHGGELKAAKMP